MAAITVYIEALNKSGLDLHRWICWYLIACIMIMWNCDKRITERIIMTGLSEQSIIIYYNREGKDKGWGNYVGIFFGIVHEIVIPTFC